MKNMQGYARGQISLLETWEQFAALVRARSRGIGRGAHVRSVEDKGLQ